jgi:hypothetical protein
MLWIGICTINLNFSSNISRKRININSNVLLVFEVAMTLNERRQMKLP